MVAGSELGAVDPEPVRSFGTFTADQHRMADWFER